MKADTLVTIDELLNDFSLATKNARAPGRNARHVPIVTQKDVNVECEGLSPRCDRWGHPYADWAERKPQTCGKSTKLSSAEKVR